MKKRSILLLALIPVLLTGCANKSVDKFEEETVMEEFESAIDTAETVEAQTKETEVEETNEVEEIEETEVSEEFSERVKNRESTLLKAAKFVDFLSTDKNIMFSPLSLDMVLGMAQSGTSNESKLSLDKSLGTDDYSLFAKNYIENIPEYETFSDLYNPIFKVSNSAWVSDTFEVKDTYKNVLDTNYKAEVFSEDFTDKEKALNDINSWIDTETNGFIPKALDDINPSTMLSLINTVYFEDEWDNPGTLTEADFTNVNGETSKVDTFYSSSCSYYMENEQATAFVKPYKNGLSFIGILPNEGISKNSNLDFNLENIDLVSLLDSKTEEYDVFMQMPTFEFDTTSRLNDLMYAENLDCLLDSRADFSGISETEKLLISDILQISRIKVDENGSKAAAATIMMMKMSAYNNNPKERKEVILDRPFAFMIYDFDNEEVVFIGKVLDVK